MTVEGATLGLPSLPPVWVIQPRSESGAWALQTLQLSSILCVDEGKEGMRKREHTEEHFKRNTLSTILSKGVYEVRVMAPVFVSEGRLTPNWAAGCQGLQGEEMHMAFSFFQETVCAGDEDPLGQSAPHS